MRHISTTCTRRLCVCASERIKLVSTLEGRYPDFGHHLENEMGGLWMYPIKLLDGFWLHFKDHGDTADCWVAADGYTAHPYGNAFHFRQGLGHTPVQLDLRQLAPESAAGVVLRYELYNRGDEARQVSLSFLARTDLRPAWSAQTLGAPHSGQDGVRWLPERRAFHADTQGHDWHVMFGSDREPAGTAQGELWGPEITAGLGVSGRMDFEIQLAPRERQALCFFIAGSQQSREDCAAQYEALATGGEALWQEKARRMEQIDETAHLAVPDEAFAQAYRWVKYNTDWLALRTPAGRGLAAGLPEYSWWFGCDSCYAVQGLLCMGEARLCRDTLHLLLRASRSQSRDGRIVHEVAADGAVYHYGNTQETAHYFIALWMYYQWTGDETLLAEALPYLDQSVEWLLAQDEDGDLFPGGYGIIEIAGLNLELIDSAVYTAKAFEIYAAMRRVLGIHDERNGRFEALAKRMIHKINVDFWDEEAGLYRDAFACGRDVRTKLDSILSSVPPARRQQAREQLERMLAEKPTDTETGWLLNRNWVINTPLEMEIAPREKAEAALANMHTDDFIGPYGMYLSAWSQKEMMTVNTGVMAAAQVRYGYADRALELLRRMVGTFGMATPGCIAEMSPDYGCFVQGWTAYAMFVPVVTGFFGVHPRAEEGEIHIRPCMPTAWPQAQVRRLPVLGGEISLAYRREKDRQVLEIDNQTEYPIRVEAGDGALLGRGSHRVEWGTRQP